MHDLRPEREGVSGGSLGRESAPSPSDQPPLLSYLALQAGASEPGSDDRLRIEGGMVPVLRRSQAFEADADLTGAGRRGGGLGTDVAKGLPLDFAPVCEEI